MVDKERVRQGEAWMRFRSDDEGFTLVELLIAIVIVGILAAIAIPVLLQQRERGYEANVQLTLDSAATAAESYAAARADSLGNPKPIGSYVGLDETELRDQGLRFDPAVQTLVMGRPGTATDYCVEVTDNRLPATNDWQTGHFDSLEGSVQPGAC